MNNRFGSSIGFLLFILIILTSCITSKLRIENQSIRKYLDSSVAFKKSFTGFSLYDPSKGVYVFKHNDHKFFTPASNTKLLTFYAGKKVLGDSIPGIKYINHEDTIVFSGMGDPTFLHPLFKNQPVYHFLSDTGKILIYKETPFFNERFGPGWSWDDYPYYFSPENTSFPIYGNVVWIRKYGLEDKIVINPEIFKRSIIMVKDSIYGYSRNEKENLFTLRNNPFRDTIETEIPFLNSNNLLRRLLYDTLGIRITDHPLVQKTQDMSILKSQPTDSLMKYMLVESDNFFAEQILLMSSGILYDTLETERFINYAIENYFPELEDKINWVDGSGLSRYNQVTPESMVLLLNRIYSDYDQDLIRTLFPNGGESGTLKDSFKNKKPYIIAKTGSMSNVYNLSGYMITKNGKWLIFSFMNNNFDIPTSEIRFEIEKILFSIHNQF